VAEPDSLLQHRGLPWSPSAQLVFGCEDGVSRPRNVAEVCRERFLQMEAFAVIFIPRISISDRFWAPNEISILLFSSNHLDRWPGSMSRETSSAGSHLKASRPRPPKEHPSLTAVAPTSRIASQGYRPPPSRYCPTRRFPAKRGRRNINLLILSGSVGDQRALIPCLERSEMQVFPSSAQARSER
jgi:hypothetical protein